jgi:hypothetical protein
MPPVRRPVVSNLALRSPLPRLLRALHKILMELGQQADIAQERHFAQQQQQAGQQGPLPRDAAEHPPPAHGGFQPASAQQTS